MGDLRNTHSTSVAKPEWERPLRRRRWENVTKTHLKERKTDRVSWNHVAQDTVQWRALANTVTSLPAS